MTRAEWVALLLSGDPDAIAARIEASSRSAVHQLETHAD